MNLKPKYKSKIPSLSSYQENSSSDSSNNFRINKILIKNNNSQQNNSNKSSPEASEEQFNLQNLDIDPIENKHGDRFVIDQVQQQETQQHFADNFDYKKTQQNIYSESKIWDDVFYGRKNIINLLQERNDVCEMYNLNSKSLKQHKDNVNPSNAIRKRVFTDLELAQYIKELFQQSPSYNEYDHMSFAIIPEVSSIVQKYYVFLGTDGRFVPQCKLCNLSAYLILNIQPKQKPSSQLTQRSKKAILIKGKILCSNTKCKKKLLGQFVISHQNKDQTITSTLMNTNIKDQFSPFLTQQQPNQQSMKKNNVKSNRHSSRKQEQKKEVPQLNERQKMQIKMASMKTLL